MRFRERVTETAGFTTQWVSTTIPELSFRFPQGTIWRAAWIAPIWRSWLPSIGWRKKKLGKWRRIWLIDW